MKTLRSFLALAASAVLLTGCATSGYQKADHTSSSLQAAAQGIDQTLIPLDEVVSTMAALMKAPSPNLTAQFQSFDRAVTSLESRANEVKSRTKSMQDEGEAYFVKWDKELAKIQNDSIQARSQERKQAVAARFEQVRVSHVATAAEFAPFMADLNDIRRVLATDLTPGGLDSVRKLAGKVDDRVGSVRQSLVRLSEEFKKLGGAISAGSPVS